MRKKPHYTGFTLIELLLVIAIIGVLSSIILVSVVTTRQRSRDTQRISDIKQLQNALQLYASDHDGAYPVSLNSLAPTYISTNLHDPLAPQVVIPDCRQNAAIYCYATYLVSGTRTFYHLGALLELNNAALASKANCKDSSSTCLPGFSATGGFDGTGALTYDVVTP